MKVIVTLKSEYGIGDTIAEASIEASDSIEEVLDRTIKAVDKHTRYGEPGAPEAVPYVLSYHLGNRIYVISGLQGDALDQQCFYVAVLAAAGIEVKTPVPSR